MGLIRFCRRHRAGTSITAAVLVAALAFGLAWFQPWKLWTDTRVDEAIPIVVEAVQTVDQTSGTMTSRGGVTVPSLSGSTTARVTASAQSAPQPGDPGTRTVLPKSVLPKSVLPSPSASATAQPPSPSPPRTAGSGAPVRSAALPSGDRAVQLLSGTLISHEHETSGSVRVIELPDGRRVLTLENLITSDGPDVHVWLAAAPVIPGSEGWHVFDDQAHVDLGQLKGNLGNQVYEIPPEVDLDQLSNVSLWCERFAVSFGAAELD